MSDPYGDAEASRYENPVASRKWLLELLEEAGRPLDYEELAVLTKTIEANRDGLFARLAAMCRDGQVITDRIGRYVLVDRAGLLSGRVVAHRDGFGFFEPDEGSDTLYLHDRQMRKVSHGDRVLVAMMPPSRHSKSKREARIVEVLERTHQRIIGRLREQAGVQFVTPEDDRFLHEILIPDHQLNGATFGQFVVVQLDHFPESNRQPVGHIIDIVGAASDPGIEVQVAVRTHDLPYQFSEEAMAQAKAFGDTIDARTANSRLDLRDLPFVTIDGEDAKDFDDAIYCVENTSGYKLYVAIADVSFYVEANSKLDKEAKKRGTSIYFPETVIPMLPEILSNGICSLRPNEDRCAMVCEMSIGLDGTKTLMVIAVVLVFMNCWLLMKQFAK